MLVAFEAGAREVDLENEPVVLYPDGEEARNGLRVSLPRTFTTVTGATRFGFTVSLIFGWAASDGVGRPLRGKEGGERQQGQARL